MHNSVRYLLLCLYGMAGMQPAAYARQAAHRDSLYALIYRQPQDTAAVRACFAYGEMLFPGNTDSAAFYYRKGLALARQLHDLRGVGIFTSYYIDVLNARGAYAQALAVVTPAAAIFRYLRDDGNLLRTCNNIGNEHQNLGNFTQAAHYYLQALKLAEKTGSRRMEGIISNNLASVLLSMEDYTKAYQYASQARQMAIQRRDTTALASSLVNLGFAATRLHRYHEGAALFGEVIQLGRQLGDSSYVMDGMINSGSIYSDMNQHGKALQVYRNLLALTAGYPAQDYRLYALLGYAQELQKTGQHAAAGTHIAAAISLAQQMNAGDELRQAYFTASEIKEAQGQPAQALHYLRLYGTLNDSLVGAGARRTVQQLEIAYQSARKDKELAEKQLLLARKDLELQQKKKWLLLFLAGIVLLSVLCGMIWLKYRHRKRLHLQKVQTLEKERTVQLLEAAMQGEERERARVSKDLHDGVGGLLSAVKMHFSAIKGELPVLRDHTAFDHALHLLDDAIMDIRQTAHNLMPETLYRYGLQEALKVFCRNVSRNGTLEVDCYTTGTAIRLNPNFELSVYRIVQELVNNIIKHSRASKALVQLSQHRHLLTITVEDNGTGFSPQVQQNGMGMRSLQSRIKALNGNIEIEAGNGQGTTAYIEFDVQVMEAANH